jgi:hypothetical protein
MWQSEIGLSYKYVGKSLRTLCLAQFLYAIVYITVLFKRNTFRNLAVLQRSKDFCHVLTQFTSF